jgi:FkbM family methyltransferase
MKKYKTIIDVGACVGEFVDYCLKQCDNVIIYGFEPLKTNYQYLINKYRDSENIRIYNYAISDFDGSSKLYKKKNLQGEYDFIGNDGSSLIKAKKNVSRFRYDEVKVKRLKTFIHDENLETIDIVKIDAEGSEYDIMNEIIQSDLLNQIDKIFFEDHSRKVKNLIRKRNKFVQEVRGLGIEDKIFVQNITDENHGYVTLQEAVMYSFWD